MTGGPWTKLLVAGKTVGMEIGLGGLVETIGDDLGGGGFRGPYDG